MHSTSIKIKYRPSSNPDDEGSLYFQFIRNRKVKVLTTSYKIFSEEWDSDLEKVKLGCFSPERESHLQELSSKLQRDYEGIKNNILRQENLDNFNLKEFVDNYRININGCLLTVFAAELEQSLIQSGNVRTARACRDAARNFIRFNNGHDFALERLDSPTLETYEKYMLNNDKHINTSSFYLRNLRKIHRSAVDQGLIQAPSLALFSTVFTGMVKTKKYAVSKEVLQELASLDFSVSTPIEHLIEKKRKAPLGFARDLFLLSFYMRGISFFDLAHLKKNDIENGLITYQRYKIGQTFKIAFTPQMKEIIDRHAEQCKSSEYLLPILHLDDSYKSYVSAMSLQTRQLNTLSGMIGLEQSLTTFVTRHTWVNIAREQGASIALISQGLGYKSEKEAMIYLDSFDSISAPVVNK